MRKRESSTQRSDPVAEREGARDLSLDALRKLTRVQLLAAAKELGLKGISKLAKDALLAAIQRGLDGRAPAVPAARAAAAPAAPVAPAASATPAAPPPRAEPEPPAAQHGRGEDDVAAREPAATAKLDLGPAAATAERPPRDIPWSYGQDRVTAAAVDPARLFVYWEVTDPAIARARGELGAGGPGAWLNLRVYDTSGRIFDGTNAHSYFDHRLERHDRQWFFDIGKPSSSAYVEVGLRSAEGYFVRIARSARVDFPRAGPVEDGGDPEWLTVRVATGEASHAGRGEPGGSRGPRPRQDAPPGAIPVLQPGGGAPGGEDARVWQLLHGEGHRVEWRQLLGGAGWFELEGRVEWEGPLLVSSWEAGPFEYPVAVEPPSREEWEGRSFAYRVGDVTHVVYGPWQVVIRNLGAHREHAEVARWEVFRSWVSSAGREVRVAGAAPGAARGGASEALGASERRWLLGSELRLGGASEVWRLGASEVRLRGASETLFAGASQWLRRGASERLGGGSEQRLGGGSDAPLPYPKAGE